MRGRVGSTRVCDSSVGVSERRVGCSGQGVGRLHQRTQKDIAKRSCTHALEATSGAPASSESSAIIISALFCAKILYIVYYLRRTFTLNCFIVNFLIRGVGFSAIFALLYVQLYLFLRIQLYNWDLSVETKLHILVQKYDGLENIEKPSPAVEVLKYT